jgi:hypothetical protein
VDKTMSSEKAKSVENGIAFKHSIAGGDVKENIIEFTGDKKTVLIS